MFVDIVHTLNDPYVTRSMYHSVTGLLLGAVITEYALRKMGL